jgi:anaerobic magnesium-protoporphyrin IX monomethyl ester cyclase
VLSKGLKEGPADSAGPSSFSSSSSDLRINVLINAVPFYLKLNTENLKSFPMRILLINPFYPISETPSPPLGLAYLAAALEAAGMEVRVLDLVVRPFTVEMLAEVLAEFRPRIVGATAVTMTVDAALAVIADVKRLRPDVVTVVGGPHVTFCAAETLAACPALDVVAIGEGEETVVDLGRAVRAGTGLAGVRGIVFREGGGVRVTARRRRIRDLDRLPLPARHLLPLGRYRALGMPISMITSRGCPHRCIFCVGRRMVGARMRLRTPVRVVDELEAIAALGFHQVNIADDLFTADAGRCAAVCDEILRRGLNLRWTAFARVDTVDRELLARMRAAGCTAVSFGIESGNPGILKTVRKGITLAQVEAAVRMCAEAGVAALASFILGLPGETPETIEETAAFARRLEAEGLIYGYHLLAPFPGTRVRERSREYGLRVLTDDWRVYHANRAVTETATVGRDALDRIARDWEERFIRYLGEIRERMGRGAATDEEAYQLTNLERIVLVYDLMMARTIERVGAWRGTREGALAELVRRVQQEVPAQAATAADALATAAGRGDLVCAESGGVVRWRWQDTLAAPQPAAAAAL